MTEPVSQPDAAQADADLARRNMRFGWALFGLFCLLFAGTIGVAAVYLWLS